MTVLKEFAKLAMGEGCRAGKEEKKSSTEVEKTGLWVESR